MLEGRAQILGAWCILADARMNFFGHLVAASWTADDTEFVLGAMLPDFCQMARVPVPACSGRVAQGIAHHHLCDGVFHGLPAFVELQARVRDRLRDVGLRKGPARACAHLGIELCLDGLWSRRVDAHERFVTAAAHASHLGGELDGEHQEAWRRFCDRLHTSRLPADYRDPTMVGEITARIVSPRPRLCLDDSELPRWLNEMVQIHRWVAEEESRIESELRAAL